MLWPEAKLAAPQRRALALAAWKSWVALSILLIASAWIWVASGTVGGTWFHLVEYPLSKIALPVGAYIVAPSLIGLRLVLPALISLTEPPDRLPDRRNMAGFCIVAALATGVVMVFLILPLYMAAMGMDSEFAYPMLVVLGIPSALICGALSGFLMALFLKRP